MSGSPPSPNRPGSRPLTCPRFRVRFKSFIEQYDLRELHYHATMRTKELEVQYNISRYEREKKRAEVETKRCRNFESQIQTFTKTEADLRSQLNVYVDKFKQVRCALDPAGGGKGRGHLED